MFNRKGFTLIELLIVVVIIGILAAIAIPKFATTKDKAKLASVKTDLRNLMTAQEAYFSDNSIYGTVGAAPGRAVQLHVLGWQHRRPERPSRAAGRPPRPTPPSRPVRRAARCRLVRCRKHDCGWRHSVPVI